MSKFKVRDKVVRVGNSAFGHLEVGKVYTVVSTTATQLVLEDTYGRYMPCNFELYKDKSVSKLTSEVVQPEPLIVVVEYPCLRESVGLQGSVYLMSSPSTGTKVAGVNVGHPYSGATLKAFTGSVTINQE